LNRNSEKTILNKKISTALKNAVLNTLLRHFNINISFSKKIIYILTKKYDSIVFSICVFISVYKRGNENKAVQTLDDFALITSNFIHSLSVFHQSQIWPHFLIAL
jgi:hypothetical protein